MSEETDNRSPLHQVEELWKQWYDTSSKIWSDTLTGANTSYGDPYGLYRSWLQTLEGEGQNAGTTAKDAPSDSNPAELWKQWIETTSHAWRQSFATNSDPFGLTTRWLEMMEETRLKLLRETAIPTDPFTFFKQWYESSHEAWSKAIEEIIGNDKFVEAASRYMESYTTFYKNFRRLNEDYFSHLQLVTRSDLTRVAEMIIALENKVDSLQDASEDLQSHYPQLATLAAIQPLASHLQTLEQKLEQIPPTFKKSADELHQQFNTIKGMLNEIPPTLQKLDALRGLEQRLGKIENTLGELPPTLQKLDTLHELSQRLDTIEGHLGELPSALHKLDALQEVDARLHAIEGNLNALPATFTRSEPTTNFEKRLDSVEQKLDTLITLLTQTDAHHPTPETATNSVVHSSNTKTRKAPKTPKKVSDETPSSTEE